MTHFFVNYKQLYRQWPQQFGALATHQSFGLPERWMISLRIQSTAIAYVRAVVTAITWSAVKFIAFGKQTWRIGGCGCNGRLLHKKCELCPGHPLLCIEGLCYGFFLLTLQERLMLGQNGREANKKNNHLANLAPEEFHTCLFSTHPRLWYLSPTLKWPQLFNTIKAKVPPDLNLEASVRGVTFISPCVLPWSSLASVLNFSLVLFSWVLFSFDFRKCQSTSTLLLTGDRGEWRRRVPRRSSFVIPSMWEKEMNVHCKEQIQRQRDPCCFRDMFLQYLVSLYTQYFSQLHWFSFWSATNAW